MEADPQRFFLHASVAKTLTIFWSGPIRTTPFFFKLQQIKRFKMDSYGRINEAGEGLDAEALQQEAQKIKNRQEKNRSQDR